MSGVGGLRTPAVTIVRWSLRKGLLTPLALVAVLVAGSLFGGVASPGRTGAEISRFGLPPTPISFLSEAESREQTRGSPEETLPAGVHSIMGASIPLGPEAVPFHPGPQDRVQAQQTGEGERRADLDLAGVREPTDLPRELADRIDPFASSGGSVRFETDAGTLTVERGSDEQFRSHWVGGEIDAGGPYGGPDTNEGTTLTITVTANDPRIIFLRYDLNGDGVFDFPDQTGGGNMGKWTTSTTITRTWYDNFYGNILVEGWDGVSTITKFSSGTNLKEPSTPQWFLPAAGYTIGWGFRAKKDVNVLHLGHYHYVHDLFELRIWTMDGDLLGSCTPFHIRFRWTWCTLNNWVHLSAGREYLITIRVSTVGVAINTPDDTDKVAFKGTYYCHGRSSLCFPRTFWSDQFIPLIDFRWRETFFLPDAARDTAFLEVNNVAPSVFDVASSPDPAHEGSPFDVTAKFDDPGFGDTWEARWTFSDGTDSGWHPVSKTTGGARVLILHSLGSAIDDLKATIWSYCGDFCTAIDGFDFGPQGTNRIPTLEELSGYDVVVVFVFWGPIPDSSGVGDRLAEFMDAAGDSGAGGGIVMMAGGLYDNDNFGIGGRWETEKTPLPRAGSAQTSVTLGTIYEPQHPILAGMTGASGGFHHQITNVTSDASRIADWSDGTVFAATKADADGRRAVGLNFAPPFTTGNLVRVLTNAIRYASRQPDFARKTMPFLLDPVHLEFADDDPTTTTHQDSFPVKVEVRDDDNGKFEDSNWTLLMEETFDNPAECDYTGGVAKWPSGWTAQPSNGWRCEASTGRRGPTIWYYYNDPLFGTGDGNSYLYTDTFDLSTFTGIRMEYYNNWLANFPMGNQNGYIQASVDGGATWITLQEYHHNDPASDLGDRFFESSVVGGYPSVRFRFYYVSWDDWLWSLDDIRLFGNSGEIIDGLGTADGTVDVQNVDALTRGGFDAAERDGNGDVLFKGFRIEDPALWESSEWFAYAWDFGDGSTVQWEYKGNMTPPKFDVLLVHSLCLSGNSCTEYMELRDRLLSLNDVAGVDGFDIMNYPGLPQAPDLDLLISYDVIVVATNWGYFSYLPWTFARRQLGDRLAQYVDAGAGGVVTLMSTFDLSPTFGDAFSLSGRYVEHDYGPFEKTLVATGDATLGTLDDPDHDLLVRVRAGKVDSLGTHSGNYTHTIGGEGEASGRNGSVLARWDDGNSAVGVKELNNGMRTVHLGLGWAIAGDDASYLLRNAIGWAAGGIPTPLLPPITHQFGNNPPYTVDLMVIDDDMGWAWDPQLGAPVEVIPPAIISHRYITIT